MKRKNLCFVHRALIGVVIVLIAICFTVVQAKGAEKIIRTDFKTTQEISEIVKIDDGKLKLSAEAQKTVASYRIGEGLSLEQFVISFKARIVKKSEANEGGDNHFGLIFNEGEKNRLMLFTRGYQMTYLDSEGKENFLMHEFEIKSGPDSDWTDFMVIVKDNFVEVNIDKRFIGNFKFDFTPVKSIDLYAYCFDVEIKNFELESLNVAGTETVDASSKKSADFFLSFDDTTVATCRGEENISPIKESGLSFVDGLRGKALQIGNASVADDGKTKNPILQYNVKDFFKSPNGSLSFWFKADWDGMDDLTDRFLLKGWDANGNEVLNFWFWNWLRLDMRMKGGAYAIVNNRLMRNYVFKNDWMHIAIVWRNDGWLKLFIDGIPYRHDPASWMVETSARYLGLDIGAVQSIGIGSGGATQHNASGVVDEFKIYRRELSDDEVMSEYRSVMPIDILMDRPVLFANEDEKIELLLAPGGHFVRPKVGSGEPVKASIAFEMELTEDESERVICSNKISLNVENEQRIVLPVGKLPRGIYRLKCKIAYNETIMQKSFIVVSHMLKDDANLMTDEDIRTGEPFFQKDFSKDTIADVFHEGDIKIRESSLGKYLESSANNGSRFAFEIKIPKELQNGRPVLLELLWPDDKPRSMGLYLYPKSDTEQHRERLGGGIQSGNEYPLTNTMQTTRYLFYPGVDSYLFEARTMISDFPAAISKVNVYPIENSRLPKLKIEYPEGMEHRRFGHMDEDETVDIMLNYDDAKERQSLFRTPNVLERWCDYFDYTGQNAISYPIMRYGWIRYPLAGYYGNQCFPTRYGEIATFIDIFSKRGNKFIAILNSYTFPEFILQPEKIDELTAREFFVIDVKGKPAKSGHLGYPKPNLLHPEVMKIFLDHVREIAVRYGNRPGFDGFEIWPWFLTLALDEGYGDMPVKLFSEETGLIIPQGDSQNKYESRYAFLTGPARAKWLRWRADKITKQIIKVKEVIHTVNPKMKLYINTLIMGTESPWVRTTPESEEKGKTLVGFCYENMGIDFIGVSSLPNVHLVPLRLYTDYRFGMFWGKPESTIDEELFDFKKFTPYINKAGVAYSTTYPTYFETFKKSLKQDVYKAYFQNADIKPFGRYFLKELVYSLAMMDAQHILIGAQPIGTWGRDAEAREFAKAYCALPAQPFNDIPGTKDPVTVRYLATSNGTYLYAANLIWSDCSAEIKLLPSVSVRDLSTGKTEFADSNGHFEIKLKPYQLRSFLIATGTKENIKIKKLAVNVPESTSRFYLQRLDSLSESVNIIAGAGMDVANYKTTMENIQNLISEGNYAEVHRLIFSKQMNALDKLRKVASDGFLKEQMEMIAKGRYAVNCGGSEHVFFRSKSGTLFFPDQKFDGIYGYDGNYKNVIRSIDTLNKDVVDPDLYKTEAYDLEAYRFKVLPGTYTVKIYFKVGYEPNAKQGINVINLDIEKERVLDTFDIFLACDSDFNKPLVKEFKGVSVKDNILDIKFSIPEGGEPTIRFCNAIEIIPENQ